MSEVKEKEKPLFDIQTEYEDEFKQSYVDDVLKPVLKAVKDFIMEETIEKAEDSDILEKATKWKIGDVDPKCPNYFVSGFNDKGQPIWKSSNKHSNEKSENTALFLKLEKLQDKINQSYNKKKIGSEKWYESNVARTYRKTWDKIMIELRGWSDYQGSEKTKQSWLDYCKKNQLAWDYNFGDILA